jgi:hypothetical protein
VNNKDYIKEFGLLTLNNIDDFINLSPNNQKFHNILYINISNQ